MSSSLLETLDALSNERPTVLQMKRRHFNPDVASSKRESLEWMRINAERERIFRFKSIAKDTATQYYTILDRFTNELVNPSNLNATSSTIRGSESPISPKRRDALFVDTRREVNLNSTELDTLQLANSTNKFSATKQSDKEAGDGSEEAKQANKTQRMGKDFKHVMQAAYKENQLHNVVRFMTDYLRQVIENGSRFTSGHLFIMLLQFSASEVKN